MELVGTKPNKRVYLYDSNHQLMGEAYVDALQEDKEFKKKSNSLPQYLHKISPKKIMEQTSSSRVSMISRASSGHKKVSVLSANQSIMFGTEKRFK